MMRFQNCELYFFSAELHISFSEHRLLYPTSFANSISKAPHFSNSLSTSSFWLHSNSDNFQCNFRSNLYAVTSQCGNQPMRDKHMDSYHPVVIQRDSTNSAGSGSRPDSEPSMNLIDFFNVNAKIQQSNLWNNGNS